MRRYGKQDEEEESAWCCIAEVPTEEVARERFPFWTQCSKPRGHGPDGLYCKQHAKMIAEGKVVPVGREEE